MSTPTSSSSISIALPSPSTLPVLLGRSNYQIWHPAIHPFLMSHQHARALLSGSWIEPRASYRRSSPPSFKLTLAPNTNSHTIAETNTTPEVQTHAQARVAWEHANLTLCRFIRSTLAMNVLPFVRRYDEAKALWDALVGLYGEGNGIAMAGGPVGRGSESGIGSVGASQGKGAEGGERVAKEE